MANERSIRDVPVAYILAALIAVSAQLYRGAHIGARIDIQGAVVDSKMARQLPRAVPAQFATIAALGEPRWFSRAMSLWLQNFDYQSGISISWRDLDNEKLVDWLDLQLQLDATNPFPMLAAAHLYGAVADTVKVRAMIDFIRRRFALDPANNWRWMANAATMAKHRLNDLALAAAIATELDGLTIGIAIPAWARQMPIFFQADLGEKATAIAQLTALLEGGQITRREELNFLSEKLLQLKNDDVLSN